MDELRVNEPLQCKYCGTDLTGDGILGYIRHQEGCEKRIEHFANKPVTLEGTKKVYTMHVGTEGWNRWKEVLGQDVSKMRRRAR